MGSAGQEVTLHTYILTHQSKKATVL